MPAEIAAFYKFFDLDDPHALRRALHERAAALGVSGLVVLAREGINATIAAPCHASLMALVSWLEESAGPLQIRRSSAPRSPFTRLNARVRDELVALGVPGVDPRRGVGRYVEPQDWDALLQRQALLLLDMRNRDEIALGTFEGAQDPGTDAFHQVAATLQSLPLETPVAMFCTGGIRCEKASALLVARGFQEVYHLRGGVLAYLESADPARSRWRGECFVFDHRVSVGPGRRPGPYSRCFVCWAILSPQERQDPAYEPGLSCPRCAGSQGRGRRAQARQRQRHSAVTQ